MRLWITFFFIFSSTTLLAQNSESGYCGLYAPQPDEIIPSNEVSGNYWTNMLDDHTVLFTSEGGAGAEYQAYDLITKKALRITNAVDPFPVPDGRRIYVHPSPLQFFEFETVQKLVAAGADQEKIVETLGHSPVKDQEARKKNKWVLSPDPLKSLPLGDEDGRMWGVYQSVGVLKTVKESGKNYSEYRILTGQEEGAFKDYRVNFNPDGTIRSVESKSKAKLMCPNWRSKKKVDLNFDTPIISPRGDEFAVTDRNSKTTKIIKFDPHTGNCLTAEDLGFEAGKIHFSPDGSKIAFHTQSLNVGSVSSVTKTNRGYLIDRKDKTITSLQVGSYEDGTTEQYPVFLSDGRIMYQRIKFNPESGTQSRSWVKVDPKKLNSAKFVTKKDCLSDENLPLIAIGKLYNQVCAALHGKDLLIWTLNMNPVKCRKLVENEWDKVKSSVLAEININSQTDIPENYLSKEMLLSACPTKSSGDAKVLRDEEFVQMRYPLVIAQRCVMCHTYGSPRGYIPFDKPEKLREMKAMGKSAEKGAPYWDKNFLEQVTDILRQNEEGKTPAHGVPIVPAEGARLNAQEIQEIIDWVSTGKSVK